MEASEAATAAPAKGQVADSGAGVEAPAAEGGEETPDVHQEIAALRQTVEDRLPPEEEGGPEVPGDFFDQLTAADFEADEFEEEPGSDFQQGQPQYDEQGQPVLSEQEEAAQLQAWVQQQAESVVDSRLQRQELNQFAEQHPDIREPEVFNGVLRQLAPLAEKFGDAAYNPSLVRMAYMAHKAEAAASSETPAEAVGRGAVLETGGGQATPESEPNPDDEYKERVFGGNPYKGVF